MTRTEEDRRGEEGQEVARRREYRKEKKRGKRREERRELGKSRQRNGGCGRM